MAKDLFDQLKQEHKIVQELMEQIMEASESSASDRKDMFQELRTNLIPHMEGEEKAFYPKLLQHSDSEMIALEAIEEHKAARRPPHSTERRAQGRETLAGQVQGVPGKPRASHRGRGG